MQVLRIARARPGGRRARRRRKCQPDRSATARVRIGVARDAAFGFYYPGDLEGLQAAGAELQFFNTLTDTSLPEVDALFIGGGFPERHMDALAANKPLQQSLKGRIQAGMPVYARMRRSHVLEPVAAVEG